MSAFWIRHRIPLQGAALFLLPFLVYLPALRGGFLWDDYEHVVNNRALRSVAGLYNIWFAPEREQYPVGGQYYPLAYSSFWLDYQLWRLVPDGYHLTNLLLHGTAAFLLWRLLLRLNVRPAWFASAVFALHPVCVESVAWIMERKNVLSMALAVGALLRYPTLRSAAAATPLRRAREWCISFTLFVGALLAKTVTSSLPAVILVLVWWKRGRIRLRQDVLPLLPFFAAGLMLGLYTAHVERHKVGALGPEFDLSALERIALAGEVLWFYASKVAWPHPLIFFYPKWKVLESPLQLLWPAAAVAVLVGLLAARRRIGRGPFAGAAIYAGVLFPALGFFNVFPMLFSWVADHFQYHASPALMVLLVCAAQRGLERIPAGRRWLQPTAGVLLLSALGGLTWQHTHDFQGLEQLWRRTLRKNPEAWLAHKNLGVLLLTRGEKAEAAWHFAKARQLAPGDPHSHSNLGVLAYQSGRLQQAETHFRDALQRDPDYVEALAGLAVTLRDLKRPGEAEELLKKHVRILPSDPKGWYLLGQVHAAQKRWNEAIRAYEFVLKRNPSAANVILDLADTLAASGQREKACARVQALLEKAPGYGPAQEASRRHCTTPAPAAP